MIAINYSLVSERTTPYRYGMNKQEKDDEVYGVGNLSAAEFWEYDTRLGRRWNVDPVVKYWESTYSAFGNNPAFLTDFMGDDVDKSKLSAEENQRITNMTDPSHEDYNKDFATTYHSLESDHSAIYTYNFKGNKPFTSAITNDKVYGEVVYGGKNSSTGQEIINIDYTFKADPLLHGQFALLEETFHAEQYKVGYLGFFVLPNGKINSLGLDQKDEVETKLKALLSYNATFSQEKSYLRAYKKDKAEGKGTLDHFSDRVLTTETGGVGNYLKLPSSKQTALQTFQLSTSVNGKIIPLTAVFFDSQGRANANVIDINTGISQG